MPVSTRHALALAIMAFLFVDTLMAQAVKGPQKYGIRFGVVPTGAHELGTLETPIVLTNTLSVPTAGDALIDYTLTQPGNEQVRSVNAVVGETNDGFLNDIRGRHVTKAHVLDAL